MTIGERLRALRKEAGLTQKELGKKLGVTASMIGQYETNLRKPKFETLKKFASVLNVSLSEFLDLSNISPSLNSALPFIETLESIQNKPADSSGTIHLSTDERNQMKELSKLITQLPDELENSSFFQKMVEEAYFSLFEELNFQGKCIAVEMIDDLSKNPDYKAK